MILHSPFTRQGSFRGVVAARGRAGGVWAIVHQGTGTTDPWHGRLAPAVDVSALCCPPVLRLAQWTAKWGWCWKLRIQSNNNFTSDLIISHLIQTLYIKCTNWRGKMSTKLCFFQSQLPLQFIFRSLITTLTCSTSWDHIKNHLHFVFTHLLSWFNTYSKARTLVKCYIFSYFDKNGTANLSYDQCYFANDKTTTRLNLP